MQKDEDEMGKLDSNFLLKTYLIIADRSVTKILSSELLSKINFRQTVFTEPLIYHFIVQ